MIPKDFKEIIPRYEYENLYQDGMPFSRKLAENLEEIKKRTFENRRKYPSMIIIDGYSGLGKTTLSFLVASYMEGKLISPEQKGEGINKFLKAVAWSIAHKRKVAIYDEAGDFEKKAFATKANRLLNRVFDIYRKYGIVVIVCLPYMGQLDNGPFQKHIPRLLLHLKEGTENQTRFWAYSLLGMLWVRHHLENMKRKNPVLEQAYSRVHPNFYGTIKRPPPWFQRMIDESSDQGKDKEFEAAMKKAEEAIE